MIQTPLERLDAEQRAEYAPVIADTYRIPDILEAEGINPREVPNLASDYADVTHVARELSFRYRQTTDYLSYHAPALAVGSGYSRRSDRDRRVEAVWGFDSIDVDGKPKTTRTILAMPWSTPGDSEVSIAISLISSGQAIKRPVIGVAASRERRLAAKTVDQSAVLSQLGRWFQANAKVLLTCSYTKPYGSQTLFSAQVRDKLDGFISFEDPGSSTCTFTSPANLQADIQTIKQIYRQQPASEITKAVIKSLQQSPARSAEFYHDSLSKIGKITAAVMYGTPLSAPADCLEGMWTIAGEEWK